MIGDIDTSNILDKESLELIIQNIWESQNPLGINIHNVLILLNVAKYDETRSVRPNWPITNPLRQLKIRRFSKKLLRRQNTYFPMI